jgi:hypothetical protein
LVDWVEMAGGEEIINDYLTIFINGLSSKNNVN